MKTIFFYAIAYTEIFPKLILHRLCLLLKINIGMNYLTFANQPCMLSSLILQTLQILKILPLDG